MPPPVPLIIVIGLFAYQIHLSIEGYSPSFTVCCSCGVHRVTIQVNAIIDLSPQFVQGAFPLCYSCVTSFVGNLKEITLNTQIFSWFVLQFVCREV